MQDRRTGLMTKVGWVQFDSDGYRSSRTKQLDTEEQARTFQRLVEENNESQPSYVTLEKHDLVEFGFVINPALVLGIRSIVYSDRMTSQAKIDVLKTVLEDF